MGEMPDASGIWLQAQGPLSKELAMMEESRLLEAQPAKPA